MNRQRPSRARSRVSAAAAVLFVTTLVAGCSSDDEPTKAAPATADRAEVVAALVQDVILPANASAATEAAAASTAIGELCESPDSTRLEVARSAVATAWGAWRATDSFDVGPAMQRRSSSVVSYKVDVAKVDATLAGSPPTDPETVRNRTSSSLRGYGAAWHLLTADAGAFSAVPARCAYLSAVMSVIADETATVDDGWTTGLDGAAPYSDTATGVGDDALSPTDMIDSLVNMQLSQLESTSKLLTAESELAPGADSDLPVGEMFQFAAQVRGIGDSYTELDALLKPELSKAISDEVDALARILADDATEPSETPPTADRAKAVATAVEELRVTIATEVVSALDVTVSFSENDGDS
jgi:predicted lipoprotein